MLDRIPIAINGDVAAEVDGRRAYAETLDLVERLHCLCLGAIKGELRRIGAAGITPTQALLIFRIGPRELTATEVTQCGCYHGSNVSYNLRKLIECGFLRQRRNPADGRSVLISLTGKGKNIRDAMVALFERHAEELDAHRWLDHGKLDVLVNSLRSLERFWSQRSLF